MKVILASLGLLAYVAVAAPLEERAELVQSNKLRRVIYKSSLLAKAQKLEDIAYSWEGRNRYSGTPGHIGTVNYLVDTLTPLNYYNVTKQDFTYDVTDITTLSVGGVAPDDGYIVMSGSPAGSVSAPFAGVANLGCDDADFPDLTGKIALIARGTCNFGLKVALAGSHGAVGAVIYNRPADATNLEVVAAGTLGSALPEIGPFVPSFSMGRDDGLEILAAVEGGAVVIGELLVTLKTIQATNVNAETFAGDHNNVIHLGAHSDSVEAGPGINDNGSGTIGILEVAIALSKFAINNAVRFSWWALEEEGIVGSAYYVATAPQSELDKIRLYLNFDMIASPNGVLAIYDGSGDVFGVEGAPGSAEAEKLFQDFFDNDEHVPWTSSEFTSRSDYRDFLSNGIPCGGLDTGAELLKTEEEAALWGGEAGVAYDINYHGPGDNVQNLWGGAFLHNTKAIAHATATYARSFDSLPPRSKRSVMTPKASRQVKDKKGRFFA